MIRIVTSLQRLVRAGLACALAFGLLTAASSAVAVAQGQREPQAQPPPASKQQTPMPAPGTGSQATPDQTRPKGVVPRERSDGARPLEKLPQTAEDKKRQLSDLYAQLATAESEEAAKPIAAQIERLWRLSGSDTVNLLISRAAKVAGEKRPELAVKLLDNAVTLAPDYTEGFSQRAFFHFSQGNMQAAVGDLRRVLALDPNHYKAMEGLVQIWRDGGNKRGAFEVAKQLLDVHPFAQGARQAHDELQREVEGRGI